MGCTSFRGRQKWGKRVQIKDEIVGFNHWQFYCYEIKNQQEAIKIFSGKIGTIVNSRKASPQHLIEIRHNGEPVRAWISMKNWIMLED